MNNIKIIKHAIKADIPLLLEGHTGTGKTYTIMQLAEEQGKTLHVINVSGELTVDSILGQQILVDGNVVWRDGVLTAAMKNGDWVLFDEMNTALPEVLTVINGVLDDSRSVTLPNGDNERVKANVEFRFIGTQNPAGSGYAGTARLNDALLNRMVRVEFGYMQPSEEVEALKKHSKLKDASLSVLADIAWYTRREEFDNPISTRDLVKIVRLRDAGGMTMRDAISIVLKDKFNSEEYNRVYNRYADKMYELERYMNGNTDVEPMEHIKQRLVEIKVKEDEVARLKKEYREEARKELLNELLGGSPSAPKGF